MQDWNDSDLAYMLIKVFKEKADTERQLRDIEIQFAMLKNEAKKRDLDLTKEVKQILGL